MPSTVIAVLGLGEAGSEIARDLLEAGAVVRAYDPKGIVVDGAQPCLNEADASAGAELVLSVNSSHDAMSALIDGLPGAQPGAVWADLNTGAPKLKASLAAAAQPYGVRVVDVALMSPVPGKGLRTPMLVSGEAADLYAMILRDLGADVVVQPGPVGSASSRKLLRSVFYKGMAAAVVEALRAAEAVGCTDWLRKNISDELAGFDDTAIDRLVTGTYAHAVRRRDEMDAASRQLADLGVAAYIAPATRDLLAAIAHDRETAPEPRGPQNRR